jgi:hypothetical protein
VNGRQRPIEIAGGARSFSKHDFAPSAKNFYLSDVELQVFRQADGLRVAALEDPRGAHAEPPSVYTTSIYALEAEAGPASSMIS